MYVYTHTTQLVACSYVLSIGFTAATCPTLPVPVSGTIDFDDITIGSVASYSCDEGFELVGSTTRTCQSDGTWSGNDPQCILVGR